jgi:hypothetical protein
MDEKVLEYLRDKYVDREQSLVSFIADGGCKSYDHYKELCGTIRGLRAAQSEIEDLVRKMKDQDDEF